MQIIEYQDSTHKISFALVNEDNENLLVRLYLPSA